MSSDSRRDATGARGIRSDTGMGARCAGRALLHHGRSAIAATLRAHVPEILDQVQAMPAGWQVLVAVRKTGQWVGVTHVLRLRTIPAAAPTTVEVLFKTGPCVSHDDLLSIIQEWAGEAPLDKSLSVVAAAVPDRGLSKGRRTS